jgi:hypothetical protein
MLAMPVHPDAPQTIFEWDRARLDGGRSRSARTASAARRARLELRRCDG